MPRLAVVSDTHNRKECLAAVPDADILIHCGDLTMSGTPPEIEKALDELAALPHVHKLVIAGNHDFLFENDAGLARQMARERGLTYLEDEAHAALGLRFWGTPWVEQLPGWAFNAEEPQARRAFAQVPDGIDVLVSHAPPFEVLDRVLSGVPVGSRALLDAVERVRPRLHVFGHIHEAAGQVQRDGTHFVNASICDVRYRATGRPVVIDL